MNTIGIIGGADGPTTIFVISDTWQQWLTAAAVAVAVIAMVAVVFFVVRKKK